jgi:hypothetical protein
VDAPCALDAQLPSRGGVIEPKAASSVHRPGTSEIVGTDLKQRSSAEAVERLVADGASRLTAERIVAIERGFAEPGRARPHATARRS